MTAAIAAAALPAEGAGFIKETDVQPVNITVDWGAPGASPPSAASCAGKDANGDLCSGNPANRNKGKNDSLNGTGDLDACSDFGWNTGLGPQGGIYSAVRNDPNGPRGPGRSYWAVCLKERANESAAEDTVSFASVRYDFDLDAYVPPGHFVYSANLTLDYDVDADDFDEGNSSAVLYGFIRDLDSGLYYKIRGDQSKGNAAPGVTDQYLGEWHGCDYLDVWDARVTPRAPYDNLAGTRADPGVCESKDGSNKTGVDQEPSRGRAFDTVCATGAPDIALGQNFSYAESRCPDVISLRDLLNGKSSASRRFEVIFRLVVRTNPGAGSAEKFSMAFDDPLFIRVAPILTPRYGATYSYGSSIPLACDSDAGSGDVTFYAQDHNKFAGEATIATVTPDSNGVANTTWSPPASGYNGISYMTGWWIRCARSGDTDGWTKIYLINKDPEVYLRGRAYYTFLPCIGVAVPTANADCQDTKGNAEAGRGDHAEDTCETNCDLADEPGKLWITVKLGKRNTSCSPPTCYATSRQPVSGDGGTWDENDLAQAAFLGCTSEVSCASENTAGSFRLATENQQGDNASHSANQDLNGDGVPDLTPSYPSDACCDYDRDDGRFGGRYSAEFSGGLTGSDVDTNARVVPKCWSEQPPTNDGDQGTDSHPNWLGGFNDCEFMQGRWSKFLFGAASFRGDGTISMDYFWWTVGLWLDDKHVFALGQHTPTSACVPTQNTDHDDTVAIFFSLEAHIACTPAIPTGPTPPLESPTAAAGVKIWVANTVVGCDTWTNCAKITNLADYVNRTLQTWNRLTSNLMDDLANFSETYPNDGGATSITALANHFLKIFGEPTNPRYVSAGGGKCSTPGVAMSPPSNPAGIFYNLLRVTAASMHATNDPFSLGVDPGPISGVDVGCTHAAMGDIKPPLRDGAALTLPAASYLLQDRRDMWYIRMNDPAIRPVLDNWFQNITLRYAKAIGPSNGSNGLNYFLKGLINADPKAWSDLLTVSFENSRDFKFFGGVVLNEQMARAFAANTRKTPTCVEGPTQPNSGCNWGTGVNETANNLSTITFLTSAIDLATQGLLQYNLLQKRMNDLNPAVVKANAEAKWGFTYWFLKTINTYFDRMPQDKFNASREESTRWVVINNYGNPGWVDYTGLSRGPAGGCGNWIYDRSAHTTSDPDDSGDGIPGDDDTNDNHGHDTTAHVNNGHYAAAYHPMQYRDDVVIDVPVFGAFTQEAGNPVKQDAGYGSLDSGWNYLLCRLKYVNEEAFKNLADALLETIGQAYKGYYAMTRYGQNAVPAIGQEPTVSDVSTQLVGFITNYLDYYRLRPAKMLYDDTLLNQQSPEYGFSGNNDYFFQNTVYNNATCPNLNGTTPGVVINCESFGEFRCGAFSATENLSRAKRCRDRYFYEKQGYNLFLSQFALKILENIDFGPTGAFYNLTKLRVERSPDLIGDPQGVQNGVTYALNYGRNLQPATRQRFAQVLTEWIPLYLKTRFDAADQDTRLPGELRLDGQRAKLQLQIFAVRWFGDWGDLMFKLRGLRGEYFNWSGSSPPSNPWPEPFYVLRTDDTLNFSWGTGSPDPVILPDRFSARWTGKVEVLAPKTVVFQVCADNGYNLTLNRTRVISAWNNPGWGCTTYTSPMAAGLHDILVEYYENFSTAAIELRWNSTGDADCLPAPPSPGASGACPIIPKERLHPPYPYDYALKTAGALRWFIAVLNTIYESFNNDQLSTLTRALTQNASRYFGDIDGCSGQTGNIHVQIGRRNNKCPSPPLVQGIESSLIRIQHEVNSRALGSLFRLMGESFRQLPNALPDLSSTTDEGIVFFEHATDLAKRLLDNVSELPSAQKNVTYDRYWASALWGLRSFEHYVNISGAGLQAGPIKLSATPGQIRSAGAEIAKNIHDLLGDAQARNGVNYLLTSLRAESEEHKKEFTDKLIAAIYSYVRFNSERSIRFPTVFLPSINATNGTASIHEYSRLSIFQRANGTVGLGYLGEPINEIQGLWGQYYDFQSLTGRLYVAYDDGAACNMTTAVGTSFLFDRLGESHDIFTDSDNTITDRWDYSTDVSSSLRTGPVLITCKVRSSGGSDAGFDAALKVGARFRIQRGDDDSNYHVTLAGLQPQINGCTGSYCYTRDYDCSNNELWRHTNSFSDVSSWWPLSASDNLNSVAGQDQITGTPRSAPLASTGETWGCDNVTTNSGDFYVWKRIEIDPFEDGELKMHRNDPELNLCFGGGSCLGSPNSLLLPSDEFAVRWTGKIDVPETRDWRLRVTAQDGVRLYVDGAKYIDDWVDHASADFHNADLFLEEGFHDIQLDYYERNNSASAVLSWNLTGVCCQNVTKDYLFTRDPEVYNRSAQSLFGVIYGLTGALNPLWVIAAKGSIQAIFDSMATTFPEFWGSFGGVFGRSYNTRYEALNSSLDTQRDQYARGSLNAYRNLIVFAGKVGEQAQYAIPNSTSAGFVRMWDYALPSNLSGAEKRDLCQLATAGLSATANRSYYFGHDNYPESWTSRAFRLDVGQNYLNTTSNCAGAPFYNITNADTLRSALLGNSSDSVVVMLKDVCPDTVCDTPLPNAVVYYDTNYATSWVGRFHALQIVNFFNQTGAATPTADPRNPPGGSGFCTNTTLGGASAPCGRTFARMNAQELGWWMTNLTARDRARGSVAVFSQDVCPDTVCENISVNNTLSRYLGAGGRVVWVGDIPLYYQGLSGGGTNTWGPAGQETILGVNCRDANGTSTSDCFPANATVTRTSAFGQWGLTQDWGSVRPVSYRLADSTFTGRYWNSATFSGTPAVVRQDSVLDFWFWRNCPQWATDCDPPYTALYPGAGSPHKSIRVDSFSSEWTGTFYQPQNASAGSPVTFVSDGDDSRAVVVDTWECSDVNSIYPTAGACTGDTAKRTCSNTTMTRGFHTLVYRMCEASGNAGANLTIGGNGWPGATGLRAVRAETETGQKVLAHHPRYGVPSLVTNISAFVKNFNPVIPDSGFVRLWDCSPGTTCGWNISGGYADARLRDLWNISTYNLTVEVHNGGLGTGGVFPYKAPDVNMAGNDSLLLDYMRRGGRVVWVGDVPMYYQGHSGTALDGGNKTAWEWGGEKKLLGVRTASVYGSNQSSTLSWEGISKRGLSTDGLVYTDVTLRPAYHKDVTYIYRKDSSDNASWWLKDFNDSIVSYKRRMTEFRTHVLEALQMFYKSLEGVADWEKKVTTYWANRYWTQVGAISTYKAWTRQGDLLRQMGSDIVNASINLIGKNESQGYVYIARGELDVDWTAGRAPWGKALLQYADQYFGLMAKVSWNASAGTGGLGVNTTLRNTELSVGRLSPGDTSQWTGVSQP